MTSKEKDLRPKPLYKARYTYLDKEVSGFESRSVGRTALVDAIQVLQRGEVGRRLEIQGRGRRVLRCFGEKGEHI